MTLHRPFRALTAEDFVGVDHCPAFFGWEVPFDVIGAVEAVRGARHQDEVLHLKRWQRYSPRLEGLLWAGMARVRWARL
jgi:hypothetical protein